MVALNEKLHYEGTIPISVYELWKSGQAAPRDRRQRGGSLQGLDRFSAAPPQGPPRSSAASTVKQSLNVFVSSRRGGEFTFCGYPDETQSVGNESGQALGGINLYEYVGSSPVSGATDPLGHYPGTKSGPIPDGQPTWGWAIPPNVKVPQGEKEWYADQPYKQYLGAQSTAGPRPGTSLTLKVIKYVIKRLPPVEEVEAWARAIESDTSFSHVRWLFRLKPTYIVRHYYLYCPATKESTPVVPGKTEVLNLATQWQDQWNGPGAVEGFHPVFPGQPDENLDIGRVLLDVLKQFLKK